MSPSDPLRSLTELRTQLPMSLRSELREILLAAATARDATFTSEGLRRRIEHLRAAETAPEGIVRELLGVVEAGPENNAERARCREAALLAMDAPEAAHYAADLVWLAANTPYSVFEHLDAAEAIDQGALWDQLGAYAERALRHEPSAWKRGELLLALAALADSDHPRARAHREALQVLVEDPLLARVLGEAVSGVEITCVAARMPRSAWLTWLYGMSGLLWLTSAWRAVRRGLFGVERSARVRFTPQALDLREVRTVRGQTEGEARTLLLRSNVVSVQQEPPRVRLPALVGALALLAGTAYGTGALIEAGRSGAASVAVFGLAAIALGFVVDYVLNDAWPRRGARVRLLVRPQSGAAFRLDEVDPKGAERVLGMWRQGG